MSTNISAWSIRHPVPTIALFIAMTVAGIAAFCQLGIDDDPNIDAPVVSVSVTRQGAAPSELDQQVTRKIEDAVAGIRDIKHILSKISDGVSQTNIEFEIGTNVPRAVNEVRNAVSKVRSQLPQDIDEPIIQEVAVAGSALATYTVSCPQRSTAELSWLVDYDISRALLSIPGVGQIVRIGGADREVRINLNPERLEALALSPETVSNQVRAMNMNSPGGRGEIGSAEQSIRTLGSAATINQLSASPIALPNGRYARLDTIGTITDGTADQRQLALLNDKPVVAFSVKRTTGSNLVQVEDAVDAKLKELKPILPSDLKIEKVKSQSGFVRRSYYLSWESLLLGSAAAVFVIWLFLSDWRSAGISALALPLSIIPTFLAIKWAGYTLNNMTLLALALVTGILVDDAIVEIENIVRHMGQSKSAYQAALDGADEIGLAVVATTMTLIVVFLPVAFMGGLPGQFFKPFGLTIAVAVFFSLVVARMMTPLMCAYWLKPMKHAPVPSTMVRVYKRSLSWALQQRLIVVLGALLLFAGSLFAFSLAPTSLISREDFDSSLLNIELPPGSTLEDTRRVVEEVTPIFLARPEVTSVFASIGSSGDSTLGSVGSQGEVNKATVEAILKPREERQLTQTAIEARLRGRLSSIAGARISFDRPGITITGKPLQIVLTSDDPDKLSRTADSLLAQMRDSVSLRDVTSSEPPLRPEILIKPDLDRAARQGVSVESIARTALIATVGDIEARMARFNLPDRQINLRVQLDPSSRQNLQVLRHLGVATNSGTTLPLSSVATVEFGYGSSEIQHHDRLRKVTIESNVSHGVSLSQAVETVKKLPALSNLPVGISYQLVGDTEKQREVFSCFSCAMAIGIPLVYGVLVILFADFFHPFTIMMSLPLSLCGALFALTASGKDVGLYALIGIILLVGLVTKNATLLVEYALMQMRNGMPRTQALMTAGAVRMRPILMTTVAMIVGMCPIVIATGAGSEVRSPMAIAVIGGLTTSSLLTLVVIPVMFTYVDDFKRWILRQAGSTAELVSAPAIKDEIQLATREFEALTKFGDSD